MSSEDKIRIKLNHLGSCGQRGKHLVGYYGAVTFQRTLAADSHPVYLTDHSKNADQFISIVVFSFNYNSFVHNFNLLANYN